MCLLLDINTSNGVGNGTTDNTHQDITGTMKPVFKTTCAIGTTWGLRTATSVPRSMHQIEMDLRNKTTSEFRTGFDRLSPSGVPNS